MTGPIFDTHAHYSARAFDADRIALLDSLPGKGVVGVCEQVDPSGTRPGCWSWRTATHGWWRPLASTRKACCPLQTAARKALRPRCRCTAAIGPPRCGR